AGGQPLLSIDYLNFSGGVSVSGTTAVLLGTDENDTISVDSAGNVTVTNKFGFNNTVNAAAFANLLINALGGDDSITIAANTPFTNITVLGGDNGTGSDTLNYTLAGDGSVDTVAQTIASAGFIVSFNGLENVNINANSFNATLVGGAGGDKFI